MKNLDLFFLQRLQIRQVEFFHLAFDINNRKNENLSIKEEDSTDH